MLNKYKNLTVKNYNFPKLYTDEYNLDSEEWKYFDSMINNRVQEQGKAEKSFPRNRVEDGMDVYNKTSSIRCLTCCMF